MAESRPLSIPVILGTSRKGRMSAHAARFVSGELQKRDGVSTELIDIGCLEHHFDDNGQGTGDPGFAASMARADAIVIEVFDERGALTDPAFVRRTDKFLGELIPIAARLGTGPIASSS